MSTTSRANIFLLLLNFPLKFVIHGDPSELPQPSMVNLFINLSHQID